MGLAFPVLAFVAAMLVPSGALADGPTMACQHAVARSAAKFTKAALKVSQRCAMRSAARAFLASCRPGPTGTGDAGADAAIARAGGRLDARLAEACADSDLSAFARRCPDNAGAPLTPAALGACLRTLHLERIAALVAIEFPGLGARAAEAAGCDSTQLCQCTCSSPSGSFLVPLTGDVF